MSQLIHKFYIYRHIRIDKNEPFYIGVGTKPKNPSCYKREYNRAYNFTKRSKTWLGVYNKTEIQVNILFESNCRQEILKKEKEFIKFYGRIKNKGSLYNFTDGGEGSLGRQVTKETKIKMSLAKSGNKFSELSKQKMSNSAAKRKISCINIFTLKKLEFNSIKKASIFLKIHRNSINNNLNNLSKIVAKKYKFSYINNN